MSDEVNPLPSTLAALVADLEARGFTVTERRSSTERTSINEFWGETILRRRAGPVDAVRVFQERLLWGVDVALEGQFHSLYDVRLALDDAKHQSRALSHDERRTMTLEVVDSMPTDAAAIAEIRRRLRRYREEYTRRMSSE